MSGAELRQLRLQLGLSQQKLAKILGVHQPTVSRWERGMSPVPKSAALVLRMLQGHARDLEAYPEQGAH